MYKIECFIPLSHIDAVKEAIFNAGAGQLGEYKACCWQVLGRGQFEPQDKSKPFIGRKGKIEKVDEYKVEVICLDQHLEDVINAIKDSHPYETPAYFVTKGISI